MSGLSGIALKYAKFHAWLDASVMEEALKAIGLTEEHVRDGIVVDGTRYEIRVVQYVSRLGGPDSMAEVLLSEFVSDFQI